MKRCGAHASPSPFLVRDDVHVRCVGAILKLQLLRTPPTSQWHCGTSCDGGEPGIVFH